MAEPFDVMLDLETFGLGPTAAIIQIGAIEFDPYSVAPRGIERRFRCDIMLQSALEHGMTIDMDTVEWWRRQGLAKLNQTNAVSLPDALLAFQMWWNAGPPANVWSNGLAFDVPIMEFAFRALGLATPWHYRNTRDVRTVKALAQKFGMLDQPKVEPAHEALQDAEAQAADVRLYMGYVAGGGQPHGT